MDESIKEFVHSINKDANKLNNNIITRTSALQNIPINNIYTKPSAPQPSNQNTTSVAAVSPVAPNTYQQQDFKKIESLINNLQSLEKKIDRFFKLIEKRVVNNSKEINIRIKLKETDESTDSKQE